MEWMRKNQFIRSLREQMRRIRIHSWEMEIFREMKKDENGIYQPTGEEVVQIQIKGKLRSKTQKKLI